MDVTLATAPATPPRSDCLVVGIYEGRKLSPSAQQQNQAGHGAIERILKRGDLKGKSGEALLLHDVDGINAERLLLIGCGKEKDLNSGVYKKIIQTMVKQLNGSAVKDAVCTLLELPVKTETLNGKIRRVTETIFHSLYRFEQLKSETPKTKHPLRKITLLVDNKNELNRGRPALAEAKAVAVGTSLARDLGNLPGNICTPTYLANEAKKLAKNHQNIKVTVLGQKEMEKLKMGSLLSVARGSRQPPKLIVMEYRGLTAKDKPHALVGKGITFDSGGISIKPSAKMDEMKFDMCGAAGVIGTMRAIAELQPKINVVGIVPSCENLPDGNANKPGDIVTSMSGQTIEILNTDAEGRLILCDALTYAEKFQPQTVIDVATLTGACVVALGKQAAGLMGNHEPLIRKILDAADQTGDRAWQLPLWEEYQEQLKSNFADMANIGGPAAGTITAACFLSRFAKKLKWAHLDIAGVAWEEGAEKGATGRPVSLLTQYLLNQCKK